MALGPLEIHQKEFNTVRMGGYNKEEVDAFLDQIADEMDRLIHRSQELMGMVENMRAKVAEYDSMQQTLQNALINAQRSAEGTLQEARAQADAILEEAREQSEAAKQEAGRAREAVMQEVDEERRRISSSLDALRTQANEFVASVRAMLDTTGRALDEFGSSAAAAHEEAPAEAEIEAPGQPAAEAPLYAPPQPAFPEPAPQEPAPPHAFPEPAPQEPVPQPAFPEPAPQEPVPQPAFPEPAPQEPVPQPAFPEPTLQEPAPPPPPPAYAEPQAYVPPIEPMEEVPVEESPIRPLETTETEVFVPSIQLDDAPDAEGQQPAPAPAYPPQEEAYPAAREDLDAAGISGFTPEAAPEASPASPVEVEQQFAPPPKEAGEEKGEKHFFWE